MAAFSIERIQTEIQESISVKQRVLADCAAAIQTCGELIARAVQSGGKVMFCGNGGSAADSQHLACELVVRLRSEVNRGAIASMALTTDPSIMTGGGNDIGFDNVFARQVEAFAKPEDVLIGISTSGNSENVIRACTQAKKQGATVIGLLGKDGGRQLEGCDASVVVPSTVTARIQESHILIGHIWCYMVEEALFPQEVSAATQ